MAISPFLRDELSHIFEEEIARLRADDLLRRCQYSPKALELAATYDKASAKQREQLFAMMATWS